MVRLNHEQLYQLHEVPDAAPTDNADDLVAQGTALAGKGKRAQAINMFRQALSIRPDHAKAHHNLGVALSEDKQYKLALAAFRNALRAQPNYAEAHYNLANTLGELDRNEEAVLSFKAAIYLKPDYIDALNNLGLALTRLGRPEEATVYLRHAIRLKPNVAEGHNNLGLAYAERGNFATAEVCYEQALRLNPHYVDAHTNLGSAFKEQGRLQEAVACYDLALVHEPDAATTHWNRSLTWLQMGNYEQGWAEYEWRHQRKRSDVRVPRGVSGAKKAPRWDGAPLDGRTILLVGEQGLGDVIQFVRYGSVVKERGGKVMVAVPPALVQLLPMCLGVDQVVSLDQELPAVHAQAPLMSLPGIFGTTLSTVPAEVPYIAAEPDKVESWRAKLATIIKNERAGPGSELNENSKLASAQPEDRPYMVGVVWQGNPRHKWDRHRSFGLAQLEPLARIPRVVLVSLQKDIGSEQIASLNNRVPVLNVAEDLTDFTDTAALIQCLDLVISCDTSVAHLAGAMGVNVWVALSTVVDWRWLLNREDTPWYPTMRLFRQERLGEWRGVFERMATVLESERFSWAPHVKRGNERNKT